MIYSIGQRMVCTARLGFAGVDTGIIINILKYGDIITIKNITNQGDNLFFTFEGCESYIFPVESFRPYLEDRKGMTELRRILETPLMNVNDDNIESTEFRKHKRVIK